MPRIFISLMVGNLIVLLGTTVTGFVGVEQNPNRHVALAMFSLLLGCFTQVVAFTYFTVTGKMIAQALHLGHLDMGPLKETRRLKRSMTYAVALVLASIVFATGTGAVHWRSTEHSPFHMAAAVIIVLAHLGIGFRQYGMIVRNADLLETTLREFRARKAAQQPPTQPD